MSACLCNGIRLITPDRPCPAHGSFPAGLSPVDAAEVRAARAGQRARAAWDFVDGLGPLDVEGILVQIGGELRLGHAIVRHSSGHASRSLTSFTLLDEVPPYHFTANQDGTLTQNHPMAAPDHWLVPKVPDDPYRLATIAAGDEQLSAQEMREEAALLLARADALEARPRDVTAEELAALFVSDGSSAGHAWALRGAEFIVNEYHVTRRTP